LDVSVKTPSIQVLFKGQVPMRALSIRLPESLHRNARVYAEREGASVNQLIATAHAEKPAVLGAQDDLASRAAGASKEKFARVGAGSCC
jgi:HicB family